MSKFVDDVTRQQLAWRKKHIAVREHGRQNGREYPWILPWKNRCENFYGPIRVPLQEYLKTNKVKPHSGIHNLKSSWVQCANTYYPFFDSEEGREALSCFLAHKVDSRIVEVESVDLEWEDKEAHLKPDCLLGELGGNRGQGQTSPDLGFNVRLDKGGRGILLVENKFVEHSFYACSARNHKGSREREANPDKERCFKAGEVLQSYQTACHQESGVGWGRKYWSHLHQAANETIVRGLTRCPAATGGYQLFRQQALAEALAQSGKYDLVYSCVAMDSGNETLVRCLRTSGLKDFRHEWDRLFIHGKARFAVFTHQDWVKWVRTNEPHQWGTWLNYMNERYGY